MKEKKRKDEEEVVSCFIIRRAKRIYLLTREEKKKNAIFVQDFMDAEILKTRNWCGCEEEKFSFNFS